MFYKVNQIFRCSQLSPLTDLNNEWDEMHKADPRYNEVLEQVFKATHSDKDYKIFIPEMYELVKLEKCYQVFVDRS